MVELENLQKQRDAYVHNLFWLGLKIAIFFAVPAVSAALLGKYLDATYTDGGRMWTIICLGFAFVLSWIITIKQFSKINKKIQAIENKIRELKKTQENNA